MSDRTQTLLVSFEIDRSTAELWHEGGGATGAVGVLLKGAIENALFQPEHQGDEKGPRVPDDGEMCTLCPTDRHLILEQLVGELDRRADQAFEDDRNEKGNAHRTDAQLVREKAAELKGGSGGEYADAVALSPNFERGTLVASLREDAEKLAALDSLENGDGEKACENCGGTGSYIQPATPAEGEHDEECWECNGTGKKPDSNTHEEAGG